MKGIPKIINLPQLIEPYLGNSRIISYCSRYLTKTGDNYGSIMLSITLNLKCPNGDEDVLPVIAKLPPITNDYYWKVFQPERTCVTEDSTYKYLAPKIKKMQLEAGINESDLFDGFTKYYGSRLSLNPNAKVADRDAVLVLENLVTAGYKPGNRQKMFDLEHTRIIMMEMAKYHALPIALRLKNPEVFDKKVRPFFGRFNMNAELTEQEKLEEYNDTIKEVALATRMNKELINQVVKLSDKYELWVTSPNASDSSYTSITHNDLWINNMMIKYDEADHPIKLKIFDFQMAQYEHIAHDIIFFLFSSVETEVLERNYIELLQLYYKTFIECLKRVGIPTTVYGFEIFKEEVQRTAPPEIWHAIFMISIILADPSTMPADFKDVDLNVKRQSAALPAVSQKILDIIRLAKKFEIMD